MKRPGTDRGADGPRGRRRREADPLDDVVSSVVAYARQETIVPLRGAGRWLAFGLAGALFVGMASVLLVLGTLRLVQDLADGALGGTWSFVPYLVCAVVAVLVTVLSLARVGGSELNKRAFDQGGSDD